MIRSYQELVQLARSATAPRHRRPDQQTSYKFLRYGHVYLPQALLDNRDPSEIAAFQEWLVLLAGEAPCPLLVEMEKDETRPEPLRWQHHWLWMQSRVVQEFLQLDPQPGALTDQLAAQVKEICRDVLSGMGPPHLIFPREAEPDSAAEQVDMEGVLLAMLMDFAWMVSQHEPLESRLETGNVMPKDRFRDHQVNSRPCYPFTRKGQIGAKAELTARRAAPLLAEFTVIPDVSQVLLRPMTLPHFTGYARAGRMFKKWWDERQPPGSRLVFPIRLSSDIYCLINEKEGFQRKPQLGAWLLDGRSSDGALLRATAHFHLNLPVLVTLFTTVAIQEALLTRISGFTDKVKVILHAAPSGIGLRALEVASEQPEEDLNYAKNLGITVLTRAKPEELIDPLGLFWRGERLSLTAELIERTDLLRDLSTRLTDPSVSCTVIHGQRGVGKTTLLAQAFNNAHVALSRRGQARCVVFDFVKLADGMDWREAVYDSVRDALPEETCFPPSGTLRRGTDRARSVVQRLRDSRHGKVILVFENLDRFHDHEGVLALRDELTLYPSEHLHMVILTVGGPEPGADPEQAEDYFEVPAFSRGELAQLLDQRLHDPSRLEGVPEAVRNQLLDLLEGNARLAVTVAAHLNANPDLELQTLVERLVAAPTDRLRRQILEYFGTLPEEWQALMWLLAAIRLPARLDELLPLLRELKGQVALDRAERAGDYQQEFGELHSLALQLVQQFIVVLRDPETLEISLLPEYQEALTEVLVSAALSNDD